MVANNKYICISNIFVLKCELLLGLGFEIIDIISFECKKEHLKHTNISKTVCPVVNIFP